MGWDADGSLHPSNVILMRINTLAAFQAAVAEPKFADQDAGDRSLGEKTT